MLNKSLAKWTAALTTTGYLALAIPGCDLVTGIFQQLLGGLGT